MMNQTRRRFLLSCGGMAASLCAGPVGAFPFATAGAQRLRLRRIKGLVMLEDLTAQVFEPLVKTTFFLSDAEGNRLPLELAELKTGAPDSQVEHMSLLFRGPLEPLLAQKIYRIEHPETGPFELFIVPVGQDSSATLYEAVFNRLKSPSQEGDG